MTSYRRRRLAASEDEVRRLAGQGVSEVTPSRRDFALYVATRKVDLAVIAHLGVGSRAQVIERARAYDDAEVAALAVATAADGLSAADMAAIAAATTAPILYDALTIDPAQLYHARLHAADAAVFPAVESDAEALRELVMIASSLHMASVIDVQTPDEIATALDLAHVIIGLSCTTDTGMLDLDRTLHLAQHVPPASTMIVLPPVRSVADCDALRGVVDAVVVGELLHGPDVAGLVRRLAGG